MVTTSGNLFHIDFGHFLGKKKEFLVSGDLGVGRKEGREGDGVGWVEGRERVKIVVRRWVKWSGEEDVNLSCDDSCFPYRV